MPDRRGRKGTLDLPDDPEWARQTWEDREAVKKEPGGYGVLRHAAEVLGLDQRYVDGELG